MKNLEMKQSKVLCVCECVCVHTQKKEKTVLYICEKGEKYLIRMKEDTYQKLM